MAPIAASSQSKSKLKAFRYEQKDARYSAVTAEADKENAPHEQDAAELQMIPPPQPLSQRSATKDTRECPQTPLGRLPLADLLATGEDTSRGHLNLTPIERVLWDNSPPDSHSSTSLSAHKGRKRAHSISASSSQNETSNHFANDLKANDLQALQKAFQTPKADPADDLWTRYSLNTDTADRRSLAIPTGGGFSQLMHSSSPQTPASHLQKDSGGLRRSLSCIEWPTSVAKRRKLFHYNSQSNPALELTNTGARGVTIERSKMSRVSLLVDKIHDGLAKPAPRQNHYSSSVPTGSSPGADRDDSPSSPRREDEVPRQASQAAIDAVATVLSQTAVDPRETVVGPLVLSDEEIASLERADSSDFYDDDLDLELMENINTNLETDRPRLSESKEPSCALGVLGPTVLPTKIDEFDDDETDMFVADLEDVCAMYDSHVQFQQPQGRGNADLAAAHTMTDSFQGAEPMEKSLTVPEVEVLSDDEDFGNDSDFEQIAAECADAAKSQQVLQPQSSVCTFRFGSSV